MKIKTKIILTLASCLIAVGSIIHFGLAERSLPGDITLADISIMAQADTEQFSEEIWYVVKFCDDVKPSISCVKNMGNEACLITLHCPQ